jgi:hypothetical protein
MWVHQAGREVEYGQTGPEEEPDVTGKTWLLTVRSRGTGDR